MMMKQKPITSSKTVRIGTVYIGIGFLVVILQIFDMLEVILSSVGAELSPNIAAWSGLVLAIIGGVQIWLRMVTTQPIGNNYDESEAE